MDVSQSCAWCDSTAGFFVSLSVHRVRSRPEWELRYQQLLEYKQKYGDCKVPQHYKENKALGKWVAKQREQFKLMKKGHHTFLTPYRLEQLNMAGFTWQ